MARKTSKSGMWGRKTLIALALILTAELASGAQGHQKIARDLDNVSSSDMVDVIVQYKHEPNALYHQKVLNRGGKLNRELGFIKAGAYRMPARAIKNLSDDDDVAYISPDRPLTSMSSVVNDYHTVNINAPAAWSAGLDGSGIGVVVIASGIVSSSPDLTAANLLSYNLVFGSSNYDEYGHGTHVAGIIAGNGASSTGTGYTYTFKGIAPGAKIYSLKVLDKNGAGTDSQVIQAIYGVIQNKDYYNVRVINLSLGRGVYESYKTDPLCQAVEAAWKAGIVVVVAAGNDGRNNAIGTKGYGTINSPGNDPYVITVGATNTRGSSLRYKEVPASYSSKGPSLWDQVIKPDLVAPGNLVISLYQQGAGLQLSNQNPNNVVPYSLFKTYGSTVGSSTYFVLSGTSMAAPMVSGAVALMLQKNPALTPDQVKARLMKTAYKGMVKSATVSDSTSGNTFLVQSDILTVGAGLLDIQAALSNTELAPSSVGSALSPVTKDNSAGNVVATVNGTSVLGGSSIL